jgi:cellulose biosynthesis protein BcsQ
MKSLAFFNNKGGVGKTTLLCNLASYLQLRKNKKILIIDADPQCNASSYVLSVDDFYKAYYSEQSFYNEQTFTINNLIYPLKKGQGYVEDYDVIASQSFGIDLIPGTPRFARVEDFLSKDWVDVKAADIRGIRTNMLFIHFLTLCHKYDYVFFDMGPSLGAINRAVLLACDYFLTPMSSDIFSLLALENIGISINEWKKDFNDSIKKLGFEEKKALDGLKESCEIKFIGYIEQQYISKSVDGKNVAVRSYEKILDRIPEEIADRIVNPINDGFNEVNYNLGSIPNFYSLIPMSQSAHKPIFNLTSTDGVLGAHYKKVNDYLNLIEKIASKVINNMEAIK